MRFFRILSIGYLVLLITGSLLGCKQQPSTEQQGPSAFDEKDAIWARIDLYEASSAIQSSIDVNTYMPTDDLEVDFWNKISSEKGTTVTHLKLDCLQDKFRILETRIYDNKGALLSREEVPEDWREIVPDSNTDALCFILAPTGQAVIPSRDLPGIRDLLLKGIKKK